MLTQIFKKVQKIFAKNTNLNRNYNFLFLLYYSINLNVFLFFENIFRKLIKFSLIFCIQNKKKFLAKKFLHLKVNLLFTPKSKFSVNLLAVQGKKILSILQQNYIFF